MIKKSAWFLRHFVRSMWCECVPTFIFLYFFEGTQILFLVFLKNYPFPSQHCVDWWAPARLTDWHARFVTTGKKKKTYHAVSIDCSIWTSITVTWNNLAWLPSIFQMIASPRCLHFTTFIRGMELFSIYFFF